MSDNQQLRERLIGYIEDAHAMELQIAETLRRHIDQAQAATAGPGAPPREMLVRMQQHLAETEMQARRMAQRLEHYGRTPSTLKDAGGQVMGAMTGMLSGLRSDTLARNMRDDYITEHLEIAAYTLLIATARAVDDEETIRAAEASLREEVMMADWIFQRLPEALFLSLEQEGIAIPAPMQREAHDGPRLHITFEPLKDVQDARKGHKKS